MTATNKTLSLIDWWPILNVRLTDTGHREAGFKEAREAYAEGKTPAEAALAIRDDRAFSALLKDGRTREYIENTANLWRR